MADPGYYDRLELMCTEAVTDSVVTTDWTRGNPGSLWWTIKLDTSIVINRDKAANRTLRELSYVLEFIQGSAGTGTQGQIRENINTNIWAITDYFETQINMTTTSLPIISGHWSGSMKCDLTKQGIGELVESGQQVRMATFRVTFRHQTIVERNI